MFFFFFNDTATTEIYTLSLHDALPILFESDRASLLTRVVLAAVRAYAVDLSQIHQDTTSVKLTGACAQQHHRAVQLVRDRKSTRLNSSHSQISYAVFCLKKKKRCNHETGQSSQRRFKLVRHRYIDVPPCCARCGARTMRPIPFLRWPGFVLEATGQLHNAAALCRIAQRTRA